MTIERQWLVVAAFAVVACSGKSVDLGGSGSGSGSAGGSGGATIGEDLDAGWIASEDASAQCAGGCGPEESCCMVLVDPTICYVQSECMVTSSCPPIACGVSGGSSSGSGGGGGGGGTGGGGSSSSGSSGGGADAGTITAGEDAGSTVGMEDAGAGTVGCGAAQCDPGQDCCIVTIDEQTCATGLQCVWGGCPPAPCGGQNDP